MHAWGKGEVVNAVWEVEKSKGLIDEDDPRRLPRKLRRFFSVVHDWPDEGLKVLEHQGRRVVILRPRLEEWLIDAAKQCGLNMADFGFSDDPPVLNAQIEFPGENFRRFLEALSGRNPPMVTKLKAVLAGP